MILAVDLGSTNMKAALYGSDGTRVAQASRPMPYEIHTNERTELSPAAVVECFHRLVEEVGSKAACRIRSVSLTSQAQTFCVADCDGGPVSPFYGWADVRAEREAMELRSALGSSFHHQTGWPDVRPTHMISKVLWWARLNGWSDKFRIVSLPSFLAMQLGTTHVSDTNLAAMSGFFSIPSKAWWGKALDAVGVGELSLGSLVVPGEPIPTGRKDRSDIFTGNLKIVMAGNDHTAGAVGCSCHHGYSTLTLGTAGVIYRHAGEKPGPYSESGLWGPYPGGGYYELHCLDHACSALDWADEFLFGNVDSPRFVEHARRAGTGRKDCFFFPERWGSNRAWTGMEKDINAYAVLEGIGFSLRSLAGATGHGGQKEMLILGGGSRLDYWVQLISDIFRCPITLSSRDGLDGAAILAGLDMPAEHGRSPHRRFLPDSARAEVLEERYLMWRRHQIERIPSIYHGRNA